MSTKTLRKRIALVAVSAMGFGLLTSVSANAFTAADLLVTDKTAQPGVCDTSQSSGAQTVTVVSGSNFSIYGKNALSNVGAYISVTGNLTVVSSTAADTLTLTTAAGADFDAAETVTFKAGAVGTGKINIGDSSTASAEEVITVTIVASCESQIFSAANSFMKAVTEAHAEDGTAAADNIDDTSTGGISLSRISNRGEGYLSIALADAYDNALASKALIATVKSGDAYVSIEDGEDGTVPTGATAKTAVVTSTGAKAVVTVVQSVEDKPTVAVVEISHNGVVVGSKTFTFEGKPSKILVSDVTVGQTGGAGYFRYQIQDEAGNNLRRKSFTADSSVNSLSDVSAVIASVNVNSSVTDYDGSKSAENTSANRTAGTVASFTCTAAGGSTSIGLKFTENVVNTVKVSVPVSCAGDLDTWAISLDKTSYAPGEIATLTVTGKDALGRLVNSVDTVGTVTYSFGGMTFVTAPTEADVFSSAAGVKTYQLSVGTTEGSYVGTLKLGGAATDTAAKTIQYKVAATGSSVTNAEVLAAIVKLIASINKQITALQKLILKKK